MRISRNYPPNISKIRAALNPRRGAIFCYGDTIYAPDGGEIGPALEAHEQVHCRRQGKTPATWWDRYLSDIKFRLDEEVLAHKVEYETAIRLVPNRQSRRAHLKIIAKRLSGSLYGNLITFDEAKRLILGQ